MVCYICTNYSATNYQKKPCDLRFSISLFKTKYNEIMTKNKQTNNDYQYYFVVYGRDEL